MTTKQNQTAKNETASKIVIDHEKYGVRSEFSSIEEAEELIHACGPDFASAKFTVHGSNVIDETGDTVGTVE